ncbi:MAG: Hpt domain-containing protein [Treponema sp.]|nr:Hpt domain-containing protein [Treponema sp.]
MEGDVVYVNFPEGLKRMMNNPKLYIKLLTKFKDGTNLSTLASAFADGDLEKTLGEAHTLKGIAANLSLTELATQCLNLELKAKAGTLDPDQMQIVKNVFDTTLSEVNRIIDDNG